MVLSDCNLLYFQFKITLCIPNPVHSEYRTKMWVPLVHNCLVWHPVFRSMYIDLTKVEGPWMCVWSFNEIIALLLCQGVAITVLLIMIHESFRHWIAFCRCSRAIWIASERKANFHAPLTGPYELHRKEKQIKCTALAVHENLLFFPMQFIWPVNTDKMRFNTYIYIF